MFTKHFPHNVINVKLISFASGEATFKRTTAVLLSFGPCHQTWQPYHTVSRSVLLLINFANRFLSVVFFVPNFYANSSFYIVSLRSVFSFSNFSLIFVVISVAFSSEFRNFALSARLSNFDEFKAFLFQTFLFLPLFSLYFAKIVNEFPQHCLISLAFCSRLLSDLF